MNTKHQMNRIITRKNTLIQNLKSQETIKQTQIIMLIYFKIIQVCVIFTKLIYEVSQPKKLLVLR